MIKHVTESWCPENYNLLNKLSATYTQDADTYSNLKVNGHLTDNYLTISTEEGGYFVLSTERWAFDSIEELIEILKDFISKVEFGSNEN
jgi:hypothetical protein